MALGEIAKQVASKAHVHVRIHDGRRTLPAKTVGSLPPQARTDTD
jgi:hypothetical protein